MLTTQAKTMSQPTLLSALALEAVAKRRAGANDTNDKDAVNHGGLTNERPCNNKRSIPELFCPLAPRHVQRHFLFSTAPQLALLVLPCRHQCRAARICVTRRARGCGGSGGSGGSAALERAHLTLTRALTRVALLERSELVPQ